jgi:hypothetical protein
VKKKKGEKEETDKKTPFPTRPTIQKRKGSKKHEKDAKTRTFVFNARELPSPINRK